MGPLPSVTPQEKDTCQFPEHHEQPGEHSIAVCNTTPKLKTFTCFPKLPLEIRRKIWKMAACEPHLIEIWQQDAITRDLNGWTYGFLHSFTYFSAAPRDPDVLQVSKESREEASLYLKRKD